METVVSHQPVSSSASQLELQEFAASVELQLLPKGLRTEF
jgi:hypothetical protein